MVFYNVFHSIFPIFPSFSLNSPIIPPFFPLFFTNKTPILVNTTGAGVGRAISEAIDHPGGGGGEHPGAVACDQVRGGGAGSGSGGAGSGSGWVGVVPLDRGDQCGSNGIR
jgi:hypothetical protein